MICPKCKADISENSRFCPVCGVDVHSEFVKGIHDPVLCPYCGAKNESDAQFCIECGRDIWNLPANPEREPGGELLSKSRKFLIVAIIIVILAVIGAAIWFFWQQDRREEPKEGKQTEQKTSAEEKTSGKSADAHRKLQASLKDYLESNGINQSVSVYYEELSSGKTFSYNSHSMRAGQSGRIFVFEYIMEAIEAGRMSQSEELLRTIKETAGGDEPASHRLVEMITGNFAESLDLVSEYVQAEGYNETVINRFNGDIGNHTSTMPNQTSVNDTAKSLRHIYSEAQTGNSFAGELLDILATNASLKQGIAKAAKQLGDGASVSNLEASWTECENDTAVVSYNGKSVLISIMIADLSESSAEHAQAMENMHEISAEICETLLK